MPGKVIREEGRLGQRTLDLRIVGTTPKWFDLVQRPMIAGRKLTPRDAEERAGVVVLTEYGARRLLATEQTIGQSLRIGGQYYEVVGIVRSEGGQGSSVQTPDQEVDAYVPIEVARERYGDIFTLRASGSFMRESVQLHQLIVQVRSIDRVEAVARGLDVMLKRYHPKNDYRISVPLALLRQAEATKRTFNIVLGSIAGISLLVGGIGIMNIMRVSVTERTREIGVRIAVGARRLDILKQFLTEASTISIIGGGLGVVCGWGMATFLSDFTTNIFNSYTPAMIVPAALAMAFVVGIISGIYPAVRAARLDPVRALRYE